jgi:hypothetical protein
MLGAQLDRHCEVNLDSIGGCGFGPAQVTVALLLLLVAYWIEAKGRASYTERTGNALRPLDLPILLVVQLSHSYILLVCWSTFTHPWVM